MRIPSTPTTEDAAPTPLHVDLSLEEGRVRARIEGALRVEDVAALERILMRISADHPKAVVVDLTHVDAVPCLAVSSLVEFSRAICRRGGTVQVIAPHGHESEAIDRTWPCPADACEDLGGTCTLAFDA